MKIHYKHRYLVDVIPCRYRGKDEKYEEDEEDEEDPEESRDWATTIYLSEKGQYGPYLFSWHPKKEWVYQHGGVQVCRRAIGGWYVSDHKVKHIYPCRLAALVAARLGE